MAVLGALGDLVLSLSADTARFQSDLGRADRVAKKFAREVGRSLGNLAGIIGFIFSGAAIKQWIGGQIEGADAAGKLAEQLGLSVEALSAFKVQAALASVEQKQFMVGMGMLAKNQADFVAGTGEARIAFAALGITEKDLLALHGDTAKIFELVVSRMNQFKEDANLTAIAMRIFGESGKNMIPLIKRFKETREEAALLNAVIDEKTAAAADHFHHNMTRAGVAVQAIGLNIAKTILPTLEGMSDGLVGAAKDAQSMGNAGAIADAGLKLLATGGIAVATVFKSVGSIIGGVFAALTSAASGEFREAMMILQQTGFDTAAQVSAAVKSIGDTWDTTARDVHSKAPDTGGKLAAPAMVAADAAKKAAKEVRDAYIKLFEFQEQVQQEANEATNEYYKKQGELNEKAAEDQKEMWRQVFETIDQEQERAIEEGQALLDATEKQNEIARELGLTFSSAFEDAIVGGKGFRDILKGIEQDIARIIIRKSITEPVAGAISGAIGSAIGGLFGGGKAEGGAVSAGVPYLVGERGPEMFVPASSGQIVANQAMGGVTVHNYYNIDSRSDRATIEMMLERNRQRTVEQIRAIQNRTGEARL